jgi:hypothetical protein
VLIIAIVVFIFLSFMAILLWMPFRLIIDSTQGVYRLEWQYIGSAMLVETEEEDMGIQIQVLFFKKFLPFEWFFQRRSKRVKQISPKRDLPKKNRDKLSVSKPRLRPNLKKILFSFKIKRCRINWDTDDYVWNAYLYPMAFFLFKRKETVIINFEGKRDIELVIENRLIRIIKSFL